jgi:hypothetical protein
MPESFHRLHELREMMIQRGEVPRHSVMQLCAILNSRGDEADLCRHLLLGGVDPSDATMEQVQIGLELGEGRLCRDRCFTHLVEDELGLGRRLLGRRLGETRWIEQTRNRDLKGNRENPQISSNLEFYSSNHTTERTQ